jgi:hypothetical protein
MRVVICSSASFYRQAIEVRDKLKALGHQVVLPYTAGKMEESGDFDVTHYKTWFGDAADYPKKAALMRRHFDEIAKGDAVLVLNYEKHGQPNYIGGNVLMEMAVAFQLNKPIFILNGVPENSSLLEEILGTGPVILNGDLDKFPKRLKA